MNTPYIITRSAWQAKVFWPPPYKSTTAPAPPTGPQLVESCPLSKQNDINSYGLSTAPLGIRAIFQAFTAPKDMTIHSFKASIRKEGAPTGNLMLWVYDTTGAFPTVVPIPGSGRPSLLFNVSGISTDPNGALCEFPFAKAAPITLNAGTIYAIAVENHGTLSMPSGAKIMLGFNFDFDTGGSAHAGNGGFYDGTWHADDAADMIFELYAEP